MGTLIVRGGRTLNGELTVQGSKNAVLPILAATLLHKGVTELTNVPRIWDVFGMIHMLEEAGAKVEFTGHNLRVDTSGSGSVCLSEKYGRQSRSSVLMLGALLARFGEARLCFPGGCPIGERPIDLHLQALEKLGARVVVQDSWVQAEVPGKMRGTVISLPFPSVGATENAMLAAAGAEGTTILCGCAREPEIWELGQFLRNMGVHVEGAGSSRIILRGGKLHDSSFRVGGDRIVAGTYLAATAMAGGRIELHGIQAGSLAGMWEAFLMSGLRLRAEPNRIICAGTGRPMAISELITRPYPGFPTDMQSLSLSVMCRAEGESHICETIFEHRFETVPELRKMGAEIEQEETCVRVCGRERLTGACVEARDLRGGAALAVAALGADGETRIAGTQHMKRGYEDLAGDLRRLGAWAQE